MINLFSTPIAGQKLKVLAQIIPAIQAIYASSRGERKGNQSTSVMSTLWDEMQKEGGMTGSRDLFKTSTDRANAIKRELDPMAWMNSGLGKIFTAGGALKVPLAVAQNKAGKQIIAGGITLGAMQALALAAAGFDDDDPPEFVRERSLIIPIGDKKYITIPMPLGFHAISNIGRISAEFAMGGFKKPAEHTVRLASVFAEAFNPIGSAGFSIQTIAPTAIDPLVALSENRDWTGKPFAKENFNKLSPTPGFSRNKDTAKWIAEAINTISGGNKYVPGMFSSTADQIDYLWGQAMGGVGREAGRHSSYRGRSIRRGFAAAVPSSAVSMEILIVHPAKRMRSTTT